MAAGDGRRARKPARHRYSMADDAASAAPSAVCHTDSDMLHELSCDSIECDHQHKRDESGNFHHMQPPTQWVACNRVWFLEPSHGSDHGALIVRVKQNLYFCRRRFGVIRLDGVTCSAPSHRWSQTNPPCTLS
jgi:hypothetical protein